MNLKIITIVVFNLIPIITQCQIIKEKEPPNIIFLSINDVNDFVGFLDGRYKAITPNMDKIANMGVNFTNAHCTTPSCGPSRNAILFGQHAFNSGLYRYNKDMQEIQVEIRKKTPEFISLPQLLKENGYNTFASGEIHCYNWTYTHMHGENEWTGHYTPKQKEMKPIEDLGYTFSKSRKFYPTLNDDSDYQSYDVVNYGIEILEKKHETPFFLALGLYEGHLPNMIPKKYFDLYNALEITPTYLEDLDDIPPVGIEFINNGNDDKKIKQADKWKLVIQSYLATLSFIDNQVGRIITALKNSENYRNTVVILWSDHGNHYGSKSKLGKFTLWEGATRVPLIIWDLREGIQKGRVCKESTSLVDLYPTIMALTGLTSPSYLDGIDLTPWLKNPQLKRDIPAITTMGRGNYAIRTKDWRYIRYHDGSEELYHNAVDKLEIKNLANIDTYQAQKKHMIKWLPKYEAPLNDMNAGPMIFYDADR
ncbi:sulfatase [Algibacter pacificus]|uniref:sulfatase n=1 Tax=Algibacter pacificus TaxID=2599389 RepID=UPI0011C8D06C|nr:sulfatase [Algibacter pacificus]